MMTVNSAFLKSVFIDVGVTRMASKPDVLLTLLTTSHHTSRASSQASYLGSDQALPAPFPNRPQFAITNPGRQVIGVAQPHYGIELSKSGQNRSLLG